MSTLEDMRSLFRDITATSTYQLSDNQVDTYINQGGVEVSERLQLFTLKSEFTFMTEPYVSEYDLRTLGASDSNVLDKYTSFEPPVYFGGYRGTYFQDIGQFRANFSENQYLVSVASGNGLTSSFSFDLTSTSLLPNRVIISTQDSSGGTQVLQDDGEGALTGDGTGTVNYVTGACSVTFGTIPASGQSIDAQYVEVRPARPVALLYFGDKFTLRPVPDSSYQVRISGFKYLTALVEDGDIPEISSWWQLITYQAAVQYFQRNRDLQSVTEFTAVLQKYEDEALYRQARQIQTQTRKTIYDGVTVNRNLIYYPYRN